MMNQGLEHNLILEALTGQDFDAVRQVCMIDICILVSDQSISQKIPVQYFHILYRDFIITALAVVLLFLLTDSELELFMYCVYCSFSMLYIYEN